MSTPPACTAFEVETRFGAAGSGGAACSSCVLSSERPIFSCAQEFKSCSASFRMLLTLREATTAIFGRTVSLDQSSHDVPSSHHHFTWPGLHGVPVTILSAVSFQRLPSTFRRTDRASSVPVSNPMMCSSLRSDFPSQIAVRQRSSSFVRSAVLGNLYQIASENRYATCVFTSLES